MATERVTFPGAFGYDLSGRLELPTDGAPVACALFAHCFTCGKNLKAAVRISRALCSRGIAVLRFDFTGLGESEGDFADTNFSSNVADLVAAGRFLSEELAPPSILVGHSLGGAAVLHAAHELPSVRAVATIAAPAEPSHLLRHMESTRAEIEAAGQATIRLGGRPFTIKRQFLDDLEETRMRPVVENLNRALLIFHSPADRAVGIENAGILYDMARHPKSFVSLDQADHLISDEDDARYLAEVLSAWVSRYVESSETAEVAKGPEPRDRDASTTDDSGLGWGSVMARTGTEAYRTEIQVRDHRLLADEPLHVGGTDRGPTPRELVDAALGACITITLRMYADRKQWPLEEITARLTHKKFKATDPEITESGDPRLDRISVELELVGDLDEAQRERLTEIAHRCPVHRMLESGAHVETTSAPSRS
jgi:putative redox protein